MAVARRREGLTGYVTMDNPPVNAIGQATRQGLLEAVVWAEAEGLERVVLSGAGRAFAAGADAREFDGGPAEPHLPEVLNRIEASRVPWIAAVHGFALGGGAEILLACRYRVARADASIGLPEVNLGIVPGAGGTQRLPRLVTMEAALKLAPTGKPVTGAGALAIGLVDAVDDDPVGCAAALGVNMLAGLVPVGQRAVFTAAAEVFDAARDAARKKMRGQDAPLRAIDLLELAQTRPLAEGLKIERAAFTELRASAQGRALRGLFFAERAARAPDWLTGAPAEIGVVAVVGGGTMGAGIAYALLNAGMTVELIETDEAGAARARENVEKIIKASVQRGLITQDGMQTLRARLGVGCDFGVAAGADLAIEAAFESMAVKQEVFLALQRVMRPDAVLATNTSYLNVDEIAAVLEDPSRLIGLHFFAPAHIMKLLEIVRGKCSSDPALATGFALAKHLRKIPVLAGVCDGFIGNRILFRYREAADALLIDGATPWQIDEAMVEFGYAMGPYEVQDLSGLDIGFANRRRLDATRDPGRRYIKVQDRMVEAGRLGRKAGIGWYRYPEQGEKQRDGFVEDLILREAREEGITRRAFTAQEITRRLLLAMINEAAEILHEGIAQSAADIDLVTVHGYGFPRWRGGLMRYADELGAENIRDQLNELCTEDASLWRPGKLVLFCAEKGLKFADWRKE